MSLEAKNQQWWTRAGTGELNIQTHKGLARKKPYDGEAFKETAQ